MRHITRIAAAWCAVSAYTCVASLQHAHLLGQCGMSSLLGMKRCHGTLCKQKCGSVAQLHGRHGCGKHCYWHCGSCVCYEAWPSTSVVTLVESTACTTRGWPWVKGSQQPCRKDTGLRHARRTSTAMVRPRVRVAYVAAMATHQCVLVLGRPAMHKCRQHAG